MYKIYNLIKRVFMSQTSHSRNIDGLIENHIMPALKNVNSHMTYRNISIPDAQNEIIYEFTINNLSKFKLKLEYYPQSNQFSNFIEFNENGVFGLTKLVVVFTILENTIKNHSGTILSYFQLS